MGRYELGELIGSGGMGSVYRALERSTGRTVALKQLHVPGASPKRRALETLFEREYHTLSRLKHPSIIEVYDFGRTAQGPYYTMELLEGDDLQAIAPLPFERACAHLRDVASALALIHAHRLVHRDISPRNIRVTRDGRAKLLDFGALTHFGVAQDVTGTPAYMSPEVLHRHQLDQRADLYSLGAVAYWLLTAHHAFPARDTHRLIEAWERPLASPSAITKGMPPELDQLVLSMLAHDTLARPPSAAVVMERLTAIANLPAEESIRAGGSYLLSTTTVGRDAELRWMKKRIDRAVSGTGAEVLIEGAPGIGKTRMLEELALAARLRGMVVLSADARACTGAFGTAIRLTEQLVVSLEPSVRRAAEPYEAVLASLSPTLSEQFDRPTGGAVEDPAEQRARAQTALHEIFRSVGSEHALLLTVDNLQALDDSSASFLAALGRVSRSTRLIVAAANRHDARTAPSEALKALRARSARLKLGELSRGAVEEFARSVFGDVANLSRVAKILHDRSGGNAQLVTDLARLLVDKEIAKYTDGMWVLPLEVTEDELPSRVEEIVIARLDALSPAARELAERLSISTKPIALEQAVGMLTAAEDRAAYEALDELVVKQILVAEGYSYHFGQESLREAVVAQLEDARRRELHRKTAEALLSAADCPPEVQVEAARHLLAAGDEEVGGNMLARAARDYHRSAKGSPDVSHTARALDTAFTLFEKQGRSRYELAGLLFTLVPLAYVSEPAICMRHAESAFALGLKVTGLATTDRLMPLIGKRLALAAGMIPAAARFRRERRNGLTYDLREAIGAFCAMLPSAMATFSSRYDATTCRRLLRMARPMQAFGEGHVASLFHSFGKAQLLMVEGRETEARVLIEGLATKFKEPSIVQALGDARWKTVYGGMLFTLGLLYPFEFGNKTPELAREMGSLGIRLWEMAADQLLLLHHALRGESRIAQKHRERMELFALQRNTTWQAEMFFPVLLLSSDVLSRDTMAVRRAYEQLARRSKDTETLEPYAQVAQAAYQGLRGEFSVALPLYERALERLEPKRSVAWASFRAHYAEALIAAGQPERAKRVVEDVLSRVSADEYQFVGRYLEPQRQLAHAEAAVGNTRRAERIVDDLLARYGEEDQPLLIGSLHKARAEVALVAGDPTAFDHHLRSMSEQFRRTDNPALIAQSEALANRGGRHVVATGPVGVGERTTHVSLSQLTAAADVCDYAVRLAASQSSAKAAFLYLFDNGRLRLAAGTGPTPPSPEIEAQLSTMVSRARDEYEIQDFQTMTVIVSDEIAAKAAAQTAGESTIFIESMPAPNADASRHRLLVLSTPSRDGFVVVGGLVLEADSSALPAATLNALAAGVYERHLSTYSRGPGD